jgi:beta-lactamase superfamily II metal-dependent hydrolase
VRLRVFHSDDGDCLLLSSSDGHHALIDGGRSGSFQAETWRTLQGLARAKEPLDLVVVSHVDADHISGILWLANVVAEWAVHDYQVTDGNNPGHPEPRTTRPPAIAELWHNAWRDQLEDVAEEIEAVAVRVSEALRNAPVESSAEDRPATDLLEALDGLAESIPEGAELRRVVDDDTPIPRNTAFGDLVLLRSPPHVERLGAAQLTVIGPAKKHLERLRKDWKAWLESIQADGPIESVASESTSGAGVHAGVDLSTALEAQRADDQRLVTSLAARATIIAKTDPGNVTPPNRASIMLLATEGTGSCLLTGDAAEEEILEGLEAAGRIQNGVFPCTVLKVQHHGSEHNLSRDFAKTVIAEHYVLCADGAHHNPDPSVVKTIVETRRAADPSPFTVWFNCSPERTLATRRKALRAAIREATHAADRHPGITVKVLRDDRSYFDLMF